MFKKLLLLIVFGLILSNLSAKQKIIIAGEDSENFPYVLGEGEILKSNPGLAIDIMRSVEKNLGITFVFKRIPWKRCMATMQKGEVDGVIDASFKTKRLEMGQYPMVGNKPDPSKKLYSANYVLYKLKGNSLDWDGKKFKNLSGSVGAPLGYSIVDDLESMGVVVDTSSSTEVDFKKLLSKRIQAVAALELEGDKFLRKYKNIIKVKIPLKTKPYYIMFSHQFVKQNPNLVLKIWKEIEAVRQKETKKFLQKYMK